MHPVDYFKSQAKKFHKDQKGRVFNSETGKYDFPNCQFFDLPRIFDDFRLSHERNPSLMQSQHVIALIAGFANWHELISTPFLELLFRAKVFSNQNRIHPLAWKESVIMQRDLGMIHSLSDEIEKYNEYLSNNNFPWTMPGYLLLSDEEKSRTLATQQANLETSKKMYPDGWYEKDNVRFEIKDGLIGRGIEISTGKNMTPLYFSRYDIDYVEGEVTAKEFWENKDGGYSFEVNLNEK